MITLASIVIDPVGYLIIAAGIIGLGFSFWNYYNIKKYSSDNTKITETANKIKDGLTTFFAAEYKFLALFVISLAILAFFYGKSQEGLNGLLAVSVIIGAASSAAASYFSRKVAVNTNEKVTSESRSNYSDAFKTSFSAGSSVGIISASAVVLGLFINLMVLSLLNGENSTADMHKYFAGFIFGASAIAIFSRLGGGIFAKSAEMAESEIVEKDAGITDKSPYNPASVANETGALTSNIGGVGADIYESFTAVIVSSMLLGIGIFEMYSLLILPLVIASIGIFTSIAGSYLLRSSEVSTSRKAINIAESFAAIVLTIGTFFAIKYTLPVEWQATKTTDNELIITTFKSLGVFWSAFFGISASVGLGYITNYFTSKQSKTVKNIAGESMKGTANNILRGKESGLFSAGIPVAIILAVVLASYYFSGFYGVSIAAVGFLGNMGLQLSFNAFAPIADNSDSIAVKAGLDEITLNQTNDLKQTGIQSVAQGKVYLAVAASLTSLALFSTFIQLTGITEVNALKPLIISSLFIGVLLPVLLSSNAIAAVRRVSKKIVKEVNRQFSEIPGLNEANEILDKYNGDLTYATEGEKEIVYSSQDASDNEQCVEIATYVSIWETLIPGIIAITIPVLTAYLGGAEILAAMLLGVITSGTIMSVYQANTGSALESTKNALEEGIVYNGELINNDSVAYQASLIGDKVGKPLKGASSPAMTVLMKVMVITAIVLIPLLINKAKKKKALQLEGLSKTELNIDNNKADNKEDTYNF